MLILTKPWALLRRDYQDSLIRGIISQLSLCVDGLVRRFIRDEEGVHFDRPSPSYDSKNFVPIEVKAGSLVVIHGDLIHQSFENQSSKSRHAYSIHVVDTEGCKWTQENWSVNDSFF